MAKWTEEQRAKFAATMQKKAAKHNKSDTLPKERKSYVRKAKAQDHIQEHAAYLYGRFENEVEHYSRSNDIPFSALAERVASLFQHQKGR